MRQQQTIGHTSTVCRFLVVVQVERVASDAHCGRMRPSIVLSYVVLLLYARLLQRISRWLTWSKKNNNQCLTGRAENVKRKISSALTPWRCLEEEHGNEHYDRITP